MILSKTVTPYSTGLYVYNLKECESVKKLIFNVDLQLDKKKNLFNIRANHDQIQTAKPGTINIIYVQYLL